MKDDFYSGEKRLFGSILRIMVGVWILSIAAIAFGVYALIRWGLPWIVYTLKASQ